jgi:galactose mutarotase-like enzyme
MQHQLISNNLTILINAFGAEVASIKNKSGLEYMWQANSQVWARHSPVLFPIVGKLNNNQFIHNTKNYTLNQHGFARDAVFKLTEANTSTCTFKLSSSDETLKAYPFEFIFQVSYQLTQNQLTTHYTVINPSNSSIFFSLGAHPAFNCPLLPNQTFEDHYLEFESDFYTTTQLNNGLRTDVKSDLTLQKNKLFLTPQLFDNDALVFENSQIQHLSLCSSLTPHKITLTCSSWPYFGVWSKKNCKQFICLEPWFGVADNIDSNQQLTHKEGIIQLEAKNEFTCSYSLIFS